MKLVQMKRSVRIKRIERPRLWDSVYVCVCVCVRARATVLRSGFHFEHYISRFSYYYTPVRLCGQKDINKN
jgi:hypothetical protein